MTQALEQLDTLIDELRHAVTIEDWDSLASLNNSVRPKLESVMDELDAGRLSPTLVQERLEDLRLLCDEGEAGATKAKANILQSLKGVASSRKAARTYQDVSVRRNK
ncbi:MAG: SOS cell division inhibitor [Marinobacter sp.]|uniref:SOS cell division inhibitor n=1 Tax=Marinobacter sp. TaxID=50741 RepID=UPI0034A08F90